MTGRRARGALTVKATTDRACSAGVPRAGSPLRRLCAVRPRGPRVRADPLGRGVPGRPAGRARPRVLRPDAAAAVRHGQRRRDRGDPPRRHPAASRDVAALPESMAAVEAHYRVDPGPQMVRMWVDRARFRPYPSDVRRLLPDRHRRAQPALPASASPLAAVVRRSPTASTTASESTVGSSPRPGTHVISRGARLAVVGNVLTHLDFRGRGFAKRGDRRGHRRSCSGPATRWCSTSAPTTRRRSRPIGGSATSSTSASRNASSTGSDRPGRISPPPSAESSPAGRRPPDDHLRNRQPRLRSTRGRQSAARPRRDRPRPRRRGRPADRVGRARDARPAPHPRAFRRASGRWPGCGSAPASTSRPRPPT